MSVMLLSLVGVAYAYVALDYAFSGRPGMALAFAAYAIANLGFIIDTALHK